MLLRSLPLSPARAIVSDLSLLFLGVGGSSLLPVPMCEHPASLGEVTTPRRTWAPGVSTPAPCVCGSAGVTLLDLPGGVRLRVLDKPGLFQKLWLLGDARSF